MLKKIIAIFALCMAVMLMSACGANKATSSSKAEESVATSSSKAESSSEDEEEVSESEIEEESSEIQTEKESSSQEQEESSQVETQAESSSQAVAGINSIDFENGDIYTAHCKNSENYTDDEAKCNFSVTEYNGSKQLKIQVLDKSDNGRYKVPKVVFDVDQLVGKENVSKIKSVKADVTAVAIGNVTMDDGSQVFAPGNCIGGFFAEAGEGSKEFVTLSEFEFAEWNNNFITQSVEGSILKQENRYVNGDENCTFIFMRWDIPNQADIYLDNITFLDDNGSVIPIIYQS